VFDTYSDIYDKWYEENKIIAENEAKAVKVLLEPGFTLEIGVGTGYFAEKLGVNIGIDPAYKPLLKAKARGIEVIQALGEELPFRDNIFDNILLIVTICFLDKPTEVLKEAWRTLKKGGSIIVCIVPRDSVWGRYYMRLKEEGKSLFYKYARLYTVREVEELLKNTGFKIKGYSATLSFPPQSKPIYEEPSTKPMGYGFVCIKGVKD